MSSVTAVKRVLLAVAALAALHPALSAQWKEDAAKLIGKEKNYRTAAQMLAAGIDGFPGPEKADAAALLAYCASRTGDLNAETRWIVEYFDTYRAADSGFVFLDLIAQSEVIGFINSWRVKYPWIMGISLIKGVGDDVIMPEGILPLVIEMANPGYYKFSENGSVIKAGLFNPGFNIIALDANALFLASGRHTYGLEIKSEGLILTRAIDLDIEVSSSRAQPVAAPPGQSARPLEYTLIVYIGGEPVLESRKTIRTVPLQLGIRPNQNPFGFKPDYMLNRDKPNPANSFNILNAVSFLYSLLKDLVKKRGRKDLPPPKVETVQDLVLTFRSKDFDGVDYESKITLKLASRVRPLAVRAP
ncbi:MAG: hypothetical protein NTZ26_07225 [Candidatus Aminicenantes bacterium]|nr:hypothetical protein [Candidatus Aminicenantes bacterium]